MQYLLILHIHIVMNIIASHLELIVLKVRYFNMKFSSFPESLLPQRAAYLWHKVMTLDIYHHLQSNLHIQHSTL